MKAVIYFHIADRPGETGDYIYSLLSGEIYKVDASCEEDGSVTFNEKYDETGYSCEVLEASEYLVLELDANIGIIEAILK